MLNKLVVYKFINWLFSNTIANVEVVFVLKKIKSYQKMMKNDISNYLIPSALSEFSRRNPRVFLKKRSKIGFLKEIEFQRNLFY